MMHKHVSTNTVGRDFVCGDLHGAFDRLINALEYLKFDPRVDRMFSVGDLVDRGPDSVNCLRLLREPWFYPVKGNHEELMCAYFKNFGRDDISPHDSEYSALWLYNGGYWGWQFAGDPSDLAHEVRDLVQLADQLPYVITVGEGEGKDKFHVLHAELQRYDGGKITDAMLEDPNFIKEILNPHHRNNTDFPITWGRHLFGQLSQRVLDELLLDHARSIETPFNDELSHIYSGHTIVKKPVQFTGQTDLDTMAYDSYDVRYGWAGLTITEPKTGKFWISGLNGVRESEVIKI